MGSPRTGPREEMTEGKNVVIGKREEKKLFALTNQLIIISRR